MRGLQTLAVNYLSDLTAAVRSGWDRFWYTPADPATLAAVRILAGAMLLYTHFIWSLDLLDFFGPNAWLSVDLAYQFHGADSWAFSPFFELRSPAEIWALHLLALAVFTSLMLGLFTRVTSVLAFLLTLSYIYRVPGALFGLDQINALLAFYVMLGPAGAAYSLDRWRLARKSKGPLRPAEPSAMANVAIRLLQVHMCVIYFFAGVSKLAGGTWWDGNAMWFAFANYEYQSLDMTWLAWWPRTVNVLTYASWLWEVSFCALVWPRLTRPLVLAGAVVLHLGIGICLGMMPFGLAMLIGCLSFVPPWLVRRVVEGKGDVPAATTAQGSG